MFRIPSGGQTPAQASAALAACLLAVLAAAFLWAAFPPSQARAQSPAARPPAVQCPDDPARDVRLPAVPARKSPAPGSPEVARLGLNYPLTGPYSVEGLDEVRAARLAVDEINAQGGILGRRVELMTRDSASDTLQSRLNLRALIDDGCRMIFGGASSAVAVTAADLCQADGVLFFGTLTYARETTLEHGHRLVFRECSDAHMAAQVLGPWLREHFPGRRYFYVTADYNWGRDAEASLRQATGTGDRKAHPGLLVSLGQRDFTDALGAARRADPGVLVLCLFGKDLAAALTQAANMGLPRSCQVVVPSLTLGMAERAGARAMQGVVGTTPWDWNVPYHYDYPRGRAFVEEFVRRFRRYPSTAGASAYSIVYEYKAAVERAGSFEPGLVTRALEGRTYRLLKGDQTWRALDHQNVQEVYLVRGNPPDKVLADPLRLEFFEIIGSRPGAETVLPEETWKEMRRAAGLAPALEPLGGNP